MSEEYAAMVTALPLFKGYTIAGAERIIRAGKIKDVAAGEVLFKEGDPADFVLLVLKGNLQVYVERSDEELILTNAGPSTILGELSILCGIPRSASVRVIENSTVLQWSASEFRGLLSKDVSLSQKIFRESLRTLIDKERTLITSLIEAEEELENEQAAAAKTE
jgi:potassium-dependent mechanosensitive channel